MATPIAFVPGSVNQRLPSGPAVIPIGLEPCRDGELGDGVGRRVDHPDLADVGLGEPEVAVGARRDPIGIGIGGGDGELGDGVGRRVDHPDRVGVVIGEPEVAVGARRDVVASA